MKEKKYFYVMVAGTVISVYISNVVYAEGLFGGLKDIASEVTKEVAGEIIKEEITETLDNELGGLVSDISGLWNEMTVDIMTELENVVIDELYQYTLSWLDMSGDDTVNTMEEIFMALTADAGMEKDEAEKMWDSVMEFAEKNDIDGTTIAKLSVSAVVSTKKEDGWVKEEADDYIVETISSWILNSEIMNQEDAENMLIEQKELFSELIDTSDKD